MSRNLVRFALHLDGNLRCVRDGHTSRHKKWLSGKKQKQHSHNWRYSRWDKIGCLSALWRVCPGCNLPLTQVSWDWQPDKKNPHSHKNFLLYNQLLWKFWFNHITGIFVVNYNFPANSDSAISIVWGSILIFLQLNLVSWFNLFKSSAQHSAATEPYSLFSKNGIIRQILSDYLALYSQTNSIHLPMQLLVAQCMSPEWEGY